jgi:dihydroorotase
MRILIKNGTVYNPGGPAEGEAADVFLEGGKIVGVAPRRAGGAGAGGGGVPAGGAGGGGGPDAIRAGWAADEVIDAEGLAVLPGLIDMHCHLRDPGFEFKEDIVSGTAAAAMGGFVAVACMPNTRPVADNAQVVRYVAEKARAQGYARALPVGAITKGLQGLELAEMGDMKEAGAVAVSDDGKPVESAALMRKALLYAGTFGLPVLSHCECRDLAEGGDMYEGVASMGLGLRGVPACAESVQVAREALLAEYTGVPVHICHVSTAQSVAVIRDAKRRGAPVTCETCPHYFVLTDEACLGYDTNAKVNPPIGSARDREAVVEGLADGTIDVIATDHAPHHRDDKAVEFQSAAFGIIGFETAFGLAYSRLVRGGALTLPGLLGKMCQNPARALRLAGLGALAPGNAADALVVDLRATYGIDPSRFLSKARNTPFGGMEAQGRVVHVVCDGRVTVRGGALVAR